jgi:hypothetical protein
MAVGIIGSKSEAFPLHDTNTPTAGSVGFVPDATGTFEGQLVDDTTDRTIPVVGGQFYPFELSVAKTTGKTGSVTELLIIFGKYR